MSITLTITPYRYPVVCGRVSEVSLDNQGVEYYGEILVEI